MALPRRTTRYNRCAGLVDVQGQGLVEGIRVVHVEGTSSPCLVVSRCQNYAWMSSIFKLLVVFMFELVIVMTAVRTMLGLLFDDVLDCYMMSWFELVSWIAI